MAAALFAALNLLPAPAVLAGQLHLSRDHLYSMASVTDAERTGLLQEIRKVNPDVPLTDLTREGPSVKLHIASGEYMEILSNELYSLAVYIPDGIESEISRRSGASFRIGRIVKDGSGVRFYFGSRVKPAPASTAGSTIAGILDLEPSPEPEHPERIGAEETAADTGSGTVEAGIRGVQGEPGRGIVDRKLRKVETVRKATPMAEKKSAGTLQEGPRKTFGLAERGKQMVRTWNREDGRRGTSSTESVVGSRTLAVSEIDGPVPVIDGNDGDEAWSEVERSVFSVDGGAVRVQASAVTDGESVYLLFTWPDDEPSTSHQPWSWDPEKEIYKRRPLLDDGIAVRWIKGGNEAAAGGMNLGIADLWMWRAGREGAGSYASDAMLITRSTPFHLASGMHRDGSESWSRLEFDRGRLPFEIVLPSSFSGPEVASYSPCKPDGSASDVTGSGSWLGGKWVVELSRALSTSNQDDIPFDRGGSCDFVVNLLQGKNLNESPASEVLTLRW